MEEELKGWRIVGSKKNIVGLLRKICMGCRECKGNVLRWKLVKRKGRSGKMLYGFECDVKKVRVFNGFGNVKKGEEESEW